MAFRRRYKPVRRRVKRFKIKRRGVRPLRIGYRM